MQKGFLVKNQSNQIILKIVTAGDWETYLTQLQTAYPSHNIETYLDTDLQFVNAIVDIE